MVGNVTVHVDGFLIVQNGIKVHLLVSDTIDFGRVSDYPVVRT